MRNDLAVCGICGTEGHIYGVDRKFYLQLMEYDWGVITCKTCGAELHFDPECYFDIPDILGGEEWIKADE